MATSFTGRVLRLRRNTHWHQNASLTAYCPVMAYGILRKGGLFVAPPLEDCLTWLTGSSTLAGTGCSDSNLADCQSPTWPGLRHLSAFWVVTHSSTDWDRYCLTSVFEWELVLHLRHGYLQHVWSCLFCMPCWLDEPLGASSWPMVVLEVSIFAGILAYLPVFFSVPVWYFDGVFWVG